MTIIDMHIAQQGIGDIITVTQRLCPLQSNSPLAGYVALTIPIVPSTFTQFLLSLLILTVHFNFDFSMYTFPFNLHFDFTLPLSISLTTFLFHIPLLLFTSHCPLYRSLNFQSPLSLSLSTFLCHFLHFNFHFHKTAH